MIIILPILIIILDQYTKKLASFNLKGSEPVVVIENFFKLSYVENAGAAFGILQNKKIIFYIITFIVLSFIFIILYKYYREMTFFMKFSLSLLIGGTIGNFIDRIKVGFVVDFFSFNILGYDFPVFNIADICIVLGTGILMVLIIREDI